MSEQFRTALKKQVERADYLFEMLERAHRELEFYADRKNYLETRIMDTGSPEPTVRKENSAIQNDNGKRARIFLHGEDLQEQKS